MSISTTELIERWVNVERVLEAMPQHERQHHWSMGTWGQKTECGTVACAAGHCGMDPWFRDRGFKLDFIGKRTEARISDVDAFFGYEGAHRIFFNSARRSVDTVLEEVRAYIAGLRRVETARANLLLPVIGTELPAHGGVFAGIRFNDANDPEFVLIASPEHEGRATWKQAMDWAAGLNIAAHRDFVLPDRKDGLVLFSQARDLFEKSWYWLSEQHAGYSYYAWIQYFTSGGQDWFRKDYYDGRARAVRRVPIQQFGHSAISISEAAA